MYAYYSVMHCNLPTSVLRMTVAINSKFRSLLSIFVLYELISDTCGHVQESQSECPTWFSMKVNNGTDVCICGDTLGGELQCDQYSNTCMLHLDDCMTYDEKNNSTVAGVCPFNTHKSDFGKLFVKLPKNITTLNAFMCDGPNRTGLLCSHCMPGLGPAMYSYTMQCLKCLNDGPGWLLYIILTTFPTTVMFLVVITCQIRFTAAPFNAFIFVTQALVSMVNSKPHTFMDTSRQGKGITLVLVTLYGIFNLDFFHYIIPPFCVSTVNSIQVVTLWCIVAIYPLFLVIVSYICIQLHARGCTVLSVLCRPFQRCYACIERRWSIDPKASLVHAFASFLLLSYSKILFVSCSLLHYVGVYNSNGSRVGPLVVYYNASVPYFSKDHLPYFFVAIFVLVTFIVTPLLILLLYPTRIFQHCLGCCSMKCHALRAFVDAFQGYYKDGTTGTSDWRCFSALYLIFRIMVVTSHTLPGAYKNLIRILCLATGSLMFSLFRPYKKEWINYLDSTIFFLFFIGELVYMYEKYILKSGAATPLLCVLTIVPLVYICIYVIYKLLFRTAIIHRCSLLFKPSCDDSYNDVEVIFEREVSPIGESYEPLLTKTDDNGKQSNSGDTCNGSLPPHGGSVYGYGSI